jgi:Xaa-Pro aminopeptidase
MVVAFAAKFVFPNEGVVGIEVDYIVREDGIECITCFPTAIVLLKLPMVV